MAISLDKQPKQKRDEEQLDMFTTKPEELDTAERIAELERECKQLNMLLQQEKDDYARLESILGNVETVLNAALCMLTPAKARLLTAIADEFHVAIDPSLTDEIFGE